jgi:hypothetical protein
MPSTMEIAYEAAKDFETDSTAELVTVMATLEESYCPDVHNVWKDPEEN